MTDDPQNVDHVQFCHSVNEWLVQNTDAARRHLLTFVREYTSHEISKLEEEYVCGVAALDFLRRHQFIGWRQQVILSEYLRAFIRNGEGILPPYDYGSGGLEVDGFWSQPNPGIAKGADSQEYREIEELIFEVRDGLFGREEQLRGIVEQSEGDGQYEKSCVATRDAGTSAGITDERTSVRIVIVLVSFKGFLEEKRRQDRQFGD